MVITVVHYLRKRRTKMAGNIKNVERKSWLSQQRQSFGPDWTTRINPVNLNKDIEKLIKDLYFGNIGEVYAAGWLAQMGITPKTRKSEDVGVREDRNYPQKRGKIKNLGVKEEEKYPQKRGKQ